MNPLLHPLVVKADAFADRAHAGQVRKYTNEPYIVHPREVAVLVATVAHTPEMLAASLLHDVVEDTPVTIEEVASEFGPGVEFLVSALSDHYTGPEHGNRAERKAKEAARLSTHGYEVHTIKVADLLSNSRTIAEYDPGFARVYMAEKRHLLSLLVRANSNLMRVAKNVIDAYYARTA